MDAFIDPNVDTSTFSMIICYNNDICTEGENDQSISDNSNGCCGENIYVPYYRADNGSCSPCT